MTLKAPKPLHPIRPMNRPTTFTRRLCLPRQGAVA